MSFGQVTQVGDVGIHQYASASSAKQLTGVVSPVIDQPGRQYTLKVNGTKLKALAGPEKRLVVSWTTGGPKRWSIAHNLALSIRKNTPESCHPKNQK